MLAYPKRNMQHLTTIFENSNNKDIWDFRIIFVSLEVMLINAGKDDHRVGVAYR